MTNIVPTTVNAWSPSAQHHLRIHATIRDLLRSLKTTDELSHHNVEHYLLNGMKRTMMLLATMVTRNPKHELLDNLDDLGIQVICNQESKQVSLRFGDLDEPDHNPLLSYVVHLPRGYSVDPKQVKSNVRELAADT